MSTARAIRRCRARKNGTPWPTKARPFRYHDGGGYDVLRPTKGWLHVSPARLRAQFRLGQMIEAINRRMGR